MQNLTEPLSIKFIDITDDDSVIVIGDFKKHSTHIYNQDVDKFNHGGSKECRYANTVDITGDGQLLLSICPLEGGNLFYKESD